MISIASAIRCLRTRGGSNAAPIAAYSVWAWPAPMPSSNRPSVTWSIAAASRARWTGCQKSLLSTSGQIRIRSVAAAIAVNGVSAGQCGPTWSNVLSTSKPARSAAMAIARRSSALLSPRTWRPNRKGRSALGIRRSSRARPFRFSRRACRSHVRCRYRPSCRCRCRGRSNCHGRRCCPGSRHRSWRRWCQSVVGDRVVVVSSSVVFLPHEEWAAMLTSSPWPGPGGVSLAIELTVAPWLPSAHWVSSNSVAGSSTSVSPTASSVVSSSVVFLPHEEWAAMLTSSPWPGPGGVSLAIELTVAPWLPSAHCVSSNSVAGSSTSGATPASSATVVGSGVVVVVGGRGGRGGRAVVDRVAGDDVVGRRCRRGECRRGRRTDGRSRHRRRRSRPSRSGWPPRRRRPGANAAIQRLEPSPAWKPWSRPLRRQLRPHPPTRRVSRRPGALR